MATTRAPRRRGGGADPARTRADLVDAAFAVLRDEGFRNASARTIATAAGCNQAAIYYHFGGIEPLLIEALTASSERRLARYRERLGAVDDPVELLAGVEELHHEDVESGHLKVLTELVGGTTAQPSLRTGIAAAIDPWLAFVTERITAAARASALPVAAAVPAPAVADVLFSVILGMQLHSKLDGDDQRFGRAVGLVRTVLLAAGGWSAR